MQSAKGSATATTEERDQPCRSAIGALSTARTAVRASTLPAAFSQPAVTAGTVETGASTNAANGG